MVNNLRNIDADHRAAGKHTLAVRFGERGSRTQYIVLLLASYLLLPVLAFFGILPWTSTLAWLSLPLGWRAWQIARRQAGSPLNEALTGTGQTTLVYSLLFLMGMLLAS